MPALSGTAADHVAVLQVNAGTASSTPLASTAVRLNRFNKALVVVHLGDMASETIDVVLQRCDSGGSNAATLKAATQLAANASANDNRQIVFGVTSDELLASGQEFIRALITTGGATGGTVTVVVLGVEPKYGPVSGFDNTTVAQVIN